MAQGLDFLLAGFLQALHLIWALDPYLVSVVRVQVAVTVSAVLLAALVALPAGVYIGLNTFPGRGFVKTLTDTGMGLPPVVVGIFLYILFSRNGPLGPLDLLNTPGAMVLAQFVLATPIIMGITVAVVEAVPHEIKALAYTMGGTGFDISRAVVREARAGLVTAVVAGFGRAVAEVGAILIVGGGIVHPVMTPGGTVVQESVTRTLTVAAVVETRNGLYGNAIAYGLILLCLAFVLNLAVSALKRRDPHVGTGH